MTLRIHLWKKHQFRFIQLNNPVKIPLFLPSAVIPPFWTGLFSCANLNWHIFHGWTLRVIFACTWCLTTGGAYPLLCDQFYTRCKSLISGVQMDLALTRTCIIHGEYGKLSYIRSLWPMSSCKSHLWRLSHMYCVGSGHLADSKRSFSQWSITSNITSGLTSGSLQ